MKKFDNENVTDIHAKVKATTTEEAVSSTTSDAFARFVAAGEEVMQQSGAPTKQRVLAATIITFLAGVTTYYWGVQLAVAFVVATLLLTGSQFIAFIAAVLGFAVAMLAAVKASTFTFDFVVNFDAEATKAAASSAIENVAAKTQSAMDFVANVWGGRHA